MIDPVHRRGRPRLSETEKRSVKVYTRVSGPMAERLYSIARHRRTMVSKLMFEYCAQLIQEFADDEKYRSPQHRAG